VLALARGRRKLYIAGAHLMHPPSGVFWLIHWNCVCVVLVLSGLILRFSAPQNVTTWFAPLVVTCLVKFKLRRAWGLDFKTQRVRKFGAGDMRNSFIGSFRIQCSKIFGKCQTHMSK